MLAAGGKRSLPELGEEQPVQPWRGRREPGASLRPGSVFAGRGLFTVERPEDANGLRVDYRLEQVDAWTWVRNPFGGGVLQAESPDQYERALERAQHQPPGVERALVTNADPGFLPDGSWPDGFTCMVEAYWNADGGGSWGRTVPNMVAQARRMIGAKRWGRVPVVVTVGCYDASSENPGVGVRLTVPDYLPDLGMVMAEERCVVGWNVWRVETLAGADLDALRAPPGGGGRSSRSAADTA